MALLPLVTIVILLVITKYWLSRRRLYHFAGQYPGPTALPLVGNLLSVNPNNVSERFKQMIGLIKKYGSLLRMWMGPELYIFTTDPKVVEQVYGDNKVLLRDPFMQTLLRPFLREGLITINGEQWKSHRKIVMSTFHTKILEQFVNNFAKNSSILADNLEKVANGTTFDPYMYLGMCSLDIICETSMGTEVNAQLNSECEYVKHTLRSLDIMGERSLKPWLMFDKIYELSALSKEQKISADCLHTFCADVIKKKLKEFEESGLKRTEEDYIEIPVGKKMAFLDLLISNSLMNEDEMMDEVTTLIFAGSETTSTTCAFVLSALGEHQDIQEKVFEEQKKIFGDDLYRAVTNDDLQQMVYLEQVINETLRVFPAVPISTRKIDKDILLYNGLTLPAGCAVMIFIYCVHRNPEYFPDPEKFDPDRFSPENSSGRHKYAYVPFGGGRRKCVGYIYSILEAKTMLSTVLRRLRVSQTVGGLEGLKETLTNNLVLKPDGGFKIQMVPRNV